MKSILTALQEGRLVEIPVAGKDKSLEYLAHLIEAIPDLAGSPELAEEMVAREKAQNTGLGLGVACPHVRAAGGGELHCAVGWSPAGIEYGSPDGKPVHLVVMYYIPDAQKNVYLKEVSSLAGAIRREDGLQAISTAEDIAQVRERLLDWVQAAIEANIPESKARMIRLEAKQAVVEAGAPPPGAASQLLQIAAALFVMDSGKVTALTPDAALATLLESDPEVPGFIRQRGQFERGGWRFIHRSTTLYGARTLSEFVAVKPQA